MNLPGLRAAPHASLVLLVCSLAGTVTAAPFTLVVTSEIVEFSGGGTGSAPLVRDLANALPGSEGGWGFADASATISESASFDSTVVTTFTFDSTTLQVDLSSVATLFLDVELVDLPGGQTFFTGSPLNLQATATGPLVIDTSASFSLASVDLTDPDLLAAFTAAIDPSAIVTVVTDAKYVLGVDINDMGGDDALTLATTGLDTTTLDLDVDSNALETLLAAILAGTASSPVNIGAAVSINGLALQFTGAVFDAGADPPFTLDFDALRLRGVDPFAATVVPEPATILLAALGGLLLWRRGADRRVCRIARVRPAPHRTAWREPVEDPSPWLATVARERHERGRRTS